jgi:hypothetical protein
MQVMFPNRLRFPWPVKEAVTYTLNNNYNFFLDICDLRKQQPGQQQQT